MSDVRSKRRGEIIKTIALAAFLLVSTNCLWAFVAYDATFFRHVGEWRPDERMTYGAMNVFCVLISMFLLL